MNMQPFYEMQKTAKELNLEDFGFQEDYSGRGMYGKSTHAIVAPSKMEFNILFGKTIVMIAQKSNMEDAFHFIDFLKDFRFDDLGTDVIVY